MRGPFLGAFLLILAACAAPEPSVAPATSMAPSPTATSTPATASATPSEPASTSTPEPAVTMIAAGDIAACDEEGDSGTAALIADLDPDATVATLGDSVYPSGSDATFAECYDPVWGAWRDRTRPSLGNHDMQADGGAAYHRYFGEDAGTPGEGYYSYDIGAWHAIVLNSNCDLVPCAEGTAQHNWLLNDLSATDATCTVAYWHHPRFTSGPHGESVATGPLWDALHAARTDVVLVGHDHLYERFAPQTPAGKADPDGIRQFTIGTGGKELYPAVRIAPNSEALIHGVFGVLELILLPDRYEWRFLTTDGTEADAGSASCH